MHKFKRNLLPIHVRPNDKNDKVDNHKTTYSETN